MNYIDKHIMHNNFNIYHFIGGTSFFISHHAQYNIIRQNMRFVQQQIYIFSTSQLIKLLGNSS